MKKLVMALLLTVPLGLYVLAQTKPAKTAPIKPGLPASMERGKALYAAQCLSCHMADGGGVPHMNPPLVETSYISADKTKMIKVVLNGFPQHVEIDGENYSNSMAPHAFMKDQEIADVITYVRGSFGNKFGPVTAAEVKAARK